MAGNGKIIIDVELNADAAKEQLSSFIKGVENSTAGGASGGSSGGGFLGNLLGGVKGAAMFGVVAKGVSMAIDGIKNSVGGAVQRFDTLNQFPKMMTAMGYSTDEAQASITKLSNGIDGLPTALDEVVATTQQIALTTGDLGKATDLTLALNNAFLSSGASAGDASRGLTQFSQMLSSGKVDMQSWKTLQETMPLALNETAKAFGFTGKSAKTDFYNALKSGEITFDDFADKLVELNNAAGGFAETAQIGSKGIATSWGNIGTAVTKGVANMVKALDDGLQLLGLGSIADNFDRLKSVVNSAFKVIVSVMEQGFKAMKQGLDWLSKAFAPLAPVFDNFKQIVSNSIEYVKGVFQGFGNQASQAWGKVLNAVQPVINFFASTFKSVWENTKTWWEQNQSGFMESAKRVWDGVKTAISTVIQHAQNIIMAVWGPLSSWFNENQELISKTVQTAWNLILTVVQFVMNTVVPFVISSWNAILAYLSPVMNLIAGVVKTGMDLILGTIKVIMQIINGDWSGAWETVKETAKRVWEDLKSTVISFIQGLWQNLVSAFGTITSGWSERWEHVKSIVASIWESIVSKASGFIMGIWEGINTGIGTIREGWDTFWNGLKEGIGIVWDTIKSTIGDKVGTIKATIDEKVQSIQETWDTFWGGLQEKLSGFLDPIIEKITTWVENVRGAFEPVAEFMSAPIQKGKEIIGTAVEGAKTGISNGWNAIVGFFNNKGAETVASAQTTAAGVETSAMGVTNSSAHYQAFADNSASAVSGMEGTIPGVLAGITANANSEGSALEATKQYYENLRNLSVNSVRNMNFDVSMSFSNLKLRAIEIAGEMQTGVIEKYTQMGTNIQSRMTSIKSTMSSMLSTIKSEFVNALSSIQSSANNGFSNVRSVIQSAMSSIVSNIQSSMSSAVNAMNSAAGQARGAGYNMGAGFYSGLASMAGSIISLAYSIANQAAAAMRSALRIHSPSRVTRQLGSYTGQGLALGIEDEARNVEKASLLLAEKAIPSMPTINPNALMGLNGSYGFGSVVNNAQRSATLHIENFNNNDGDTDVKRLMRQMDWIERQTALGGI